MTASFAAAAVVLVAAAWAWGRLIVSRAAAPASRRARRQPPPTAEQWAAFLDLMSAEVRTGSSLASAMQHAIRRCSPNGAAIHHSTTLPLAPPGAASTVPLHADESVVVQAIAAAHELGGPVALALDAASALLRERSAIRAEAHAHAAQARLSARVLTAVPLVFIGWSLATSASFRAAVLGSAGAVSVALGALCNLAGWQWMQRIIRRAGA